MAAAAWAVSTAAVVTGGRRRPIGGAHLSASQREEGGAHGPAQQEEGRAQAREKRGVWTGPTAQEEEKGGKRKKKKKKGFSWD